MHIPNSSYRIQFNPDFTFNSASEIIEYLWKLGVSDLYASPILKARKGSTHGYDVVDPNQLNSELGSEDEFYSLIEKLKSNQMFWLQDIVPNHMAYNYENQMLVDLLENGPNSRYHNIFDIEWRHPYFGENQRLLAPFLGSFYQQALEKRELKLLYGQEGFNINYYDNKLPLNFESYIELLSFNFEKLRNKLGRNNSDVIKYLGVLYVLKSLPSADEIDERYDQIKFVKGMLWELYSENLVVKAHINETLKAYNGETGNPESLNLLDNLLSKQYFRLSFWKVATEEINYRRFFNVNELISLKMENEETFYRTHSFIIKLIKDEVISGLRIDHVDGLYDPINYLQRLKNINKNLYLIVEKILALDENLPANWPVEGTSGYDFMNYLNGIFCRTENEKRFTNIYLRFIRVVYSFEKLAKEKKRLIVKTRMAGEVERLAFIIDGISQKDRFGVDITMHGIKEALEEILIDFPIYRTYINSDKIDESDKNYIENVINEVKENNPRLINEFNYIGNLLLLKYGDHYTVEQKAATLDFVMKFQQLTGPLMAKGFEDTALYIYNRFLSLNEVGGDPGKFGISLTEFHSYNKKKIKEWPHSFSSTSTHDTKRGEDVRARLNVLSEIPDEWEEKVKQWTRLNKLHQNYKNKGRAIDRNDEYFLYQTLVGSFPFNEDEYKQFIKRIKEYVIKAVREAKVYTAWLKPDNDYENAFTTFVEKILTESNNNLFLLDFIQFTKKISFYGIFNSLSQTLVKFTAPGIPDIYQGAELWDLTLVDPDNRRPVNYDIRRKYLEEIREKKENLNSQFLSELLREKENGKVKLFLIYNLLHSRKKYNSLFNHGDYSPVKVNGEYEKNVISFYRSYESNFALTVAPRFLTSLIKPGEMPLKDEIWKNTSITPPAGIKSWKNILTGEIIENKNSLKIGEILKNFPAALLFGKIKS